MVRAVIAGGLALLLAVQVVRNAVVISFAEVAPDSAARAWAGHPAVQFSLGMTEIAKAAGEGRPVPPAALDRIYGAAVAAPLAPEPFLVRGVEAQLAGNVALAERAFAAAKWRDGRSLPARYFLANHYFRERDAAKGLREIVALARLVPSGIPQLAPYVAQYATDPANAEQLRSLFRAEPGLELTALIALAHDPRNAPLVLSLATPERRNAKSGWLPLLVNRLIEDRQYARARRIWAEVSGAEVQDQFLFDPQFTRADEPPPFNWSLTSSTVGLAERQRGSGLRVIYYGQEDGPLATQLLLLPPGSYRLATKASGANRVESVRWSITCTSATAELASTALGRAVQGEWRFTVPADCPAQRLALIGVSSDSPQQADFTIEGVRLIREQPLG